MVGLLMGSRKGAMMRAVVARQHLHSSEASQVRGPVSGLIGRPSQAGEAGRGKGAGKGAENGPGK